MLTQSILAESISLYERNSHTTLRAAREAILPEPISLSFCTSQVTENGIKELADTLPTGGKKEDELSEFIYVFRLSIKSRVKTEELLAAFIAARDLQCSTEYNGKKNLCRPNAILEISQALYVGRSYKPRERFKQHLRDSTSGTYAIHFATWATELDATVDFHLYRFSDLGDRVVQIIEDGLWDKLKPSLGKRGER